MLTHGNLDAERDAAFARGRRRPSTDAVLGVLPLFHSLAQMANLLLPLSVGARVVFLETRRIPRPAARRCQERGITIFACVPQFFYLIHQRVTGRGRARAAAPARALFRALLRANHACRARLAWNPGTTVFARVHRALGPRMRLLVTGGSKFDPAIGRDLYGLGFTHPPGLRPHRDARARPPSSGPSDGALDDGRAAAARRRDPDRTAAA